MHPFAIHARLLHAFHNKYNIVPDYERILECAYRLLVREGDTVIDVGAHAGRHTAALAEAVGPSGSVIAFEPLPNMFGLLQEQGFGQQVRLLNYALSDISGRSTFTHARGTPSESGLLRRIYNRPDLADPEEIEVEVRRLDEFLPGIKRLSFIKIDTEGAEVACLRGATQTLSQFRPYIAVEYGALAYAAYGLNARSLFDLAIDFDYVLGDLFGAVCPDLQTWERVVDTVYWDWFLVPRERSTEWRLTLASDTS